MKSPNVMRKRMILDPSPGPVPFTGQRRRERSPRTTEYQPTVKLVTGELPSDGNLRLKELVRPGFPVPTPEVTRQRRINGVIGDVLGGISVLLLVGLWLSILFGLIGMLLGISMPFVGDEVIPISLYGIHIFGVPGAILNQRTYNMGVIAIGGFWFTIMAALPVGFVVSQLMQLIGG
ncbi:hypothetical protein [Haloferula sp. A504]|uniref:hypothetical protein n=1 Tax=Haloferula sp. A504 TaxID=3373601 RepID=UPI0031C979CC|nr:hypothetical protein [Verrucomicrobiaceae bacterium E54]